MSFDQNFQRTHLELGELSSVMDKATTFRCINSKCIFMFGALAIAQYSPFVSVVDETNMTASGPASSISC